MEKWVYGTGPNAGYGALLVEALGDEFIVKMINVNNNTLDVFRLLSKQAPWKKCK